MHKLTLVASLVLPIGLVTAGCGGSTPTTPTTFSSSSVSALSISPSPLVGESVDQFACPAEPPFDVPFQLLINTNDTGFVVTNITARFVDTSGLSMPQITLPAPATAPMPQVTLSAPVPTTQFGATSGESESLPLSVAIGCGTGHTGTLTLLVATVDGQGHTGSTQLTASVR